MHRDQLQAHWIQAQNWIPQQTLQAAYQECVFESGQDLCGVLLARGALTPQQAQVIRTAAARSQHQVGGPRAQAWGAAPRSATETAPRPPLGAAGLPSETVLSSATALDEAPGQPKLVLELQQRLGDYEILGEIARGAMGVIYRARRAAEDREVALKVTLDAEPDETDQARFRREVGVLQRLDHPNIVRVLDLGWGQRHLYFTMELLEGSDLRAVIDKGGLGGSEPPWLAAASTLIGVARALDYCHETGVVHRDVKPQNVIWEPERGRAVLIDFGLLKKDRSKLGSSQLTMGVSLTSAGQILGTPAYMAPEQFSPEGDFGPVGPPCDVWGFGATLYHAVTGALPFPYSTAIEIFQAIIERGPRLPSELNPLLPSWLDGLLLSCLARSTRDRPTMAEVVESLEQGIALQRSQEEAPRVEPPAPRSPRSSGRTRSRRTRPGSGVAKPPSGERRSTRSSGRFSGAKAKPRSSEPRRRRSAASGGPGRWLALALAFIVLGLGGVAVLRPSAAAPPRLEDLRLSATWSRAPEVEVSGRLRGEGRVLVAGRACSPEAGGRFCDTVSLRAGRNTIEVQVFQGVKLLSSESLEAFHDGRAPEIAITNADPPGTARVTAGEVAGLVRDASPVRLELDGVPCQLKADGRFALRVAPGSHCLMARDKAGNLEKLSFQVAAEEPANPGPPEESSPVRPRVAPRPPPAITPPAPVGEASPAARPKPAGDAKGPTPRSILEDLALWRAADEGLQDRAIDLVTVALGPGYVRLRPREFAFGGDKLRLGSFRHKATRIVLRLIPGGAFTLGQDLDEALERALRERESELSEAEARRERLEAERAAGVDDLAGAVDRLAPVVEGIASAGEAEARRRLREHFAQNPKDGEEIRRGLRRARGFGRGRGGMGRGMPQPGTDDELIDELVAERRRIGPRIRGLGNMGRRGRRGLSPERAAEIAAEIKVLDERIARLRAVVSVRARSPAVRMRVAPFLIAETETPTAAWNKVAKKGLERARGPSSNYRAVGGVSWTAAKRWLRLAGGGLRLPGEAEWEYACRAGGDGRFFWGPELDGAYAAAAETSGGKPRSWTGADLKKRVNLFGLLNSSGNMAEWCEDDWSESYRGRRSAAPFIRSELAGRDLLDKVLRGGDYASSAREVEARARRAGAPGASEPRFGFRVARSLDLDGR